MKLTAVTFILSGFLLVMGQNLQNCRDDTRVAFGIKTKAEKLPDGTTGLISQTETLKNGDQVYIKIILKEDTNKGTDRLFICFPTTTKDNRPYLKYDPIKITFTNGEKLNKTFYIDIKISEKYGSSRECIEYLGNFNVETIALMKIMNMYAATGQFSLMAKSAECKGKYSILEWKLNWNEVQKEPTLRYFGFFPCPNGHQVVPYASKTDDKLQIWVAIRQGAFDDFLKLVVMYEVQVTVIDQASVLPTDDSKVSTTLNFTPETIDKMNQVGTFDVKPTSRPKAKFVDDEGNILVKISMKPKNGCESI